MAQHPFLKSIRPVNLLSFGPETQEIELRPLNILIGANGSGKSNLIEILGLLSKLPDKDPWSNVIQTGGAREWIWKGKTSEEILPSLSIESAKDRDNSLPFNNLQNLADLIEPKHTKYSVKLREFENGFTISNEIFIPSSNNGRNVRLIADDSAYVRDGAKIHTLLTGPTEPSPRRSVLSSLGSLPDVASKWPELQKLADTLEQFAFYRDWTFGHSSETRQLQPVGLDSYHLASDSANLAQVLKAMRDRGDSAVFERLLELLQSFYAPVKDVDTELVGTHLRIMLKEEGLSSRTPAERLSDGTLRWLMLLIILLDPTPPPVICLDEPELGLHPDAIHVLADLLVEASERTQLIVTTHSSALVDAFSDAPEAICVCEKVDGATQIRRLDKERLAVWLKEYSLGYLWASGEIGGNRW